MCLNLNIIIFGKIASGKDTLADFLVEAFNYKKLKLGKYIREQVDKLSLQPFTDRRNEYQQYGQSCRRIFGYDVWNEATFREIDINLPVNFIIADGRQVNEYDYWKSKGFFTVGIFADETTRDERVIARDGKSQKEHFNHETETQAGRCVQKSDFIVNNNGGFEELHEQIFVMLAETLTYSSEKGVI